MPLDEDDGRRAGLGMDRRTFLHVAGGVGLGGLGVVVMPRDAIAAAPPTTPRRSRAIVIGLNEYEHTDDLVNPVRDACRFAEWLVQKAGVRPGDVELLTSPAQLPTDVPRVPGVVPKLASRENLAETIDQFPERAKEGERLYFYYSGHGLAYKPRELRGKIDQQDAIVPCDFKRYGPKPISIQWILDLMMASRFDEQFFFFDACRNIDKVKPADEDVPDILERAASPLQYVLFSTAPRSVSLERLTGSFTDALLGALSKGAGSSVAYRSTDKKYLVRWDLLAQYLIDHFHRNPVRLGIENDKDVFQEPERDVRPGDFGRESPYLVVLNPDEVASRTLTIDVQPPELRPKVKITVTSLLGGAIVVRRAPAPLDEPFVKQLPPGQYNAMLECDDPQILHFSGRIDLDEDRSIKMPDPSNPPEEQLLDEGGSTSLDPRGLLGSSLLLKASDPHAQIELLDASGAPVRLRGDRASVAMGKLDAIGIDPGVYRVRVYPPNAPMTERIVPLGFGARKELDLGVSTAESPPAPAGLGRAISEAGGERPAGLDAVMEQTRAQAHSPASYIVQAMRAMDHDPAQSALLAKGLGLTPFAGEEGIRVVLGVDLNSSGNPRETLQTLKVSLAGLGGGEWKTLYREPCLVEGIGIYNASVPPGPYRLRIERPDDRADFALVVMKGRLGQLILEQDVDRTFVTQFAPPARSEGAPDIETFFNVARLERALQGGASRTAPALLAALKTAGAAEPMVPILDAYMAMIAGDSKALGASGQALVDRFPTLPDGHVALARTAEVDKHEDRARKLYLQALDLGLPVLSVFLKKLQAGVKRQEVADHPRLKLLREAALHQTGLLWSAWVSPGD